MKTLDTASSAVQENTGAYQENKTMSHVIGVWAEAVRQDGNINEANKLIELCDKEREGLLMIAMCGHFSAGKSTVINQMCGKRLLPSSPIPTSANVVTIRNGERRAEILFRGRSTDQLELIPLERLEEVCQDGESIERVNLYEEVEWLREGAALLDTPGVDSTDDLHREATEAALHMADVVCYVTDYNHVLSEINFAFAKQVAEAGKPLIWIVNQIDKHRESELSFEQYRSSVSKALHDWGIHPAAVFYVSMMDADHIHNEWAQVVTALRLLVKERKPLVASGVEQAARFILLKHEEQKREKLTAEHREWIESAGGESVINNVRNALHTAEEQEQHLMLDKKTERTEFQVKVNRLLRDANIIPAPLRDLAAHYLESRQIGFRVGLWNRGEKTEAERERRLNEVQIRWKEEIQTNIFSHLSSLAREYAGKLAIEGDTAVDTLLAAMPELGGRWLADFVQEGAAGTNEYILNYCRLISEEAKSLIRKAVWNEFEPYLQQIEQRKDQEIERINAEIAVLRSKLLEDERFLQAANQLVHEEARLVQMMDGLFSNRAKPVSSLELMPDLSNSALLRACNDTSSIDTEEADTWNISILELNKEDVGDQMAAYGQSANRTDSPHPMAGDDVDARARWRAAAEQLELSASAIDQYASIAHMSEHMRAKAKRLRDNRFSVALFGAFSAGKSSFANALMGAELLPVSPNPTTAAINRILGPSDEHPHRTALIRMKKESELLADIRYALECMGEAQAQKFSLQEALQQTEHWQPEMLHPAGKPHYSFIQAVKRGYDSIQHLLGQELHVTYEEYREYVSNEERSAFVNNVDLFAHNPWTAQGFTFVDTPGADSINARHTGVSFEYIKNADIILFVTYYNHAFSQADRQFLTQLGRVKDTFELDKMFFIVNAADLAASSVELDSVMEYMRARLQEFGIRSPRLFAVSSLQALDRKLSGHIDQLPRTGFTGFEREFQHFAGHELTAMAVQSAEHDMLRAHSQLEVMAAAAVADKNERLERQQQLRQAVQRAEQQLRSLTYWNERKRLEQETDELLYYVRQRIQYRTGDSFSMAFNPATLRGDNTDIERSLLQCYGEWQRSFEKELTNELLATSLRLEQLAKRLIVKRFDEILVNIQTTLNGFNFALPVPISSWTTPHIEVKKPEGVLTSRKLKSLYRSSKAFFEGGGREELRGLLEQEALEQINGTNQWIKQKFLEHLETRMSITVQDLVSDCVQVMQEYEAGMMFAYGESVDADELRRTSAQLKSYIRKLL
ncbi:dynamin family protein [Paenibacillus marinisediminis]